MTTLQISVPESSLSALRRSPTEFGQELKQVAAIYWYQHGTMSQERAAELAGLSRRDFIRMLRREGVDVMIVDPASLARELGLGEPNP